MGCLLYTSCHPYDGRDRVTPENLKHDIEQSFERLGTDYIDIYLMHRDDPKVEPGPMVEILNEYHKAGRIGAFGGSNWTHQRIAEANQYAGEHGLIPFTVSSPNFGLCDQIGDPWGGGPGCVTISGPSNAEARAWYRDNQIPVLAYSSLGRGMFAGIVKSDDICLLYTSESVCKRCFLRPGFCQDQGTYGACLHGRSGSFPET